MQQRLISWVCRAIVIAAVGARASEPIRLSGEQDGHYEAAEYMVARDVVVKEGRTLRFAAGALVRFAQYAGIVVEGALVCEGEVTRPVVFTSEHDRGGGAGKRQPQPFDWNGITLAGRGATVELSYVKITYSTFGIRCSSDNCGLSLEKVVFGDNGMANLAIADSTVDIAERTPVDMRYPAEQEAAAAIDSTGQEAATDESGIEKRERKAWKAPLRIAFGALALGGAATAGVCHKLYLDRHADYMEVSRSDADTDEEVLEKQATLQEYENEANNYRSASIVGGILGAIGGVGFVVTWVF